MYLLIFFLVYYLATCWGLSLLFKKANIPSQKAWIPGVNFVEWCKLIGRKPSHALWLLFPIVNIFTFTAMAVDLVRSFDRLKFKDTFWAVVCAPFAFFNAAKDNNYVGPILEREQAYQSELMAAKEAKDDYKIKKLEANNPFKKGTGREWIESMVFAIFAASFIRMLLIEAFVIPTPSMEGSLNVGDYLFVSKAHYGIRTPSTIAMFPLLHNRLPFFNAESYFEKPSLNAHRLPAIEKIEVGKPIVFNWPVGDSVYLLPDRSYAAFQIDQNPQLKMQTKGMKVITRPVDKRDHYIKRCMGVAGDSMQIINKQVFINGKAVQNPENMQFRYLVTVPPSVSLPLDKMSSWKIEESVGDLSQIGEGVILSDSVAASVNSNILGFDKLSETNPQGMSVYRIRSKGENNNLTPEIFQAEVARLNLFTREQVQVLYAMVLSNGQKKKVQDLNNSIYFFELSNELTKSSLFPFTNHNWTVDNYGPIWIPKKGATVNLTLENLPLFNRTIGVYEGNALEVKGGQILINGAPATSYTFKQDYYWAMGDNRHNSEDSRMWGYVPFDHIVGKPLFMFFSTKEGSISKGINWDRLFKSATSKH